MLFAVNIANSKITFGVFDENGELIFKSGVDAVRTKSADEYAVLFSQILTLRGADRGSVTDAILSSVVPSLTRAVLDAVRILFGIAPIEVGPGIKTGLNIKIDQQTQLGADLVASAVAALAQFRPPMAIVDLGHATTVTVINREGMLEGVLIAPGVRASMDVLSRSGAELPDVSLLPPKRLIGKNTQDSMRSGVLYGHAAMLDGLLERVRETIGAETMTVVATGEHLEAVLPFCKVKPQTDADLTLRGLYLIREKNKR